MKCVSVNIVMTYPVHWSSYQVLRDFVQNFYDAAGYSDWQRRFRYSYHDSALSMWVDGVSFHYEWLMHIGASTKTDQSDQYAGFFGEGFKIASLCAFRDLQWGIEMMSEDWHLEVTETDHYIDHTPVKMLAYNISRTENIPQTRLILKNVSEASFAMFQTVLDSFFYPENPIMGELLWQGKEGAVFLRSKTPVNPYLPHTDKFGNKGAVFCGYQMLGTNPFGLVVCLHKYHKADRERNSLYAFDVIRVFENICQYVSASCAMIMLQKMRRYWNTYPRKKYDIYSWSRTIDLLIWKLVYSPETKAAFHTMYPDLLCVERIHTIADQNMRWQAKAWLDQQSRKYILVKDTFMKIGYPSLEDVCCRDGGPVCDEEPDKLQEKCFAVLEEICREIFPGFFSMDLLPQRKVIINSQASYHGMAVTVKRKQPSFNIKGIRIRYDVRKIYLKSDLFKNDGYYDGLSTYIHEMCHMFGGDSSSSFSLALTYTLEILMKNQEEVLCGKEKWDQLFL